MTGQKATAGEWETGRSAEAAVWALRAADSAADLESGDQVDPMNVEERAGALQELVEFVY